MRCFIYFCNHQKEHVDHPDPEHRPPGLTCHLTLTGELDTELGLWQHKADGAHPSRRKSCGAPAASGVSSQECRNGKIADHSQQLHLTLTRYPGKNRDSVFSLGQSESFRRIDRWVGL